MKVFISRNATDGILRVIEAQVEHLPQFGVEIASHPAEADVVCTHGADKGEYAPKNVPIVNINHGLYWSRQPWGDDFMDVNRMVVEAMQAAVAHTVPSEWVGRAVRRGGYWYPEVVYHGVDADKFVPTPDHENYILWNKARADFVSDPRDVHQLSLGMPKRQFVSTIGHAHSNLRVVGIQPHAKMKELVSMAGVYLSTARETFGIGILEAMAYGIPVAGWDWGGNSEIIVHGQTGYLAPPGDFKALAECVELCFRDRETLSRNALADVRERWGWEPRIEQYAGIFKRVHETWNSPKPKVSVIVTAYKLDKYLPACLNSIARQTFADFECLVVDDASLPSTERIVNDYAKRDKRFSYHPTPNNFGLPGARNFGLSRSRGAYVRHVDADDYLADHALELETAALDADRNVHIVYGHLETVRDDGNRVLQNGEPVRSGWPEPEFKWNYQMAHLNQLPSCSMARREVYERSGGYRERMKRNEDAEFWCRVTSLGFRAKKFTQAVTYFHRERGDSKGATEWQTEGAEPDWTAWFPWRWGGHDFQSGWDALRKRGDVPRNIHLVPFGAQGPAPKPFKFWYVHDYAYPVVSVIVTCGPGHKPYLIDALDSIQAQTYPDWEVVVVNDTGADWGVDIMGAPWAKVVSTGGNRGASVARNEGIKHIHPGSRYIVWMDADDYWLPWFLERMVAHAEHNDGAIFSDLIMQTEEKTFKINKYADFASERVIGTMQYPGSSVLYPRKIVEAMVEYEGGFDENAPGMEDWFWQVGVHHLGFCAYRIPEALFVYRMYSSTKRETDYARIDAITGYMDRKYPAYRKGEKKIMCGCSGTKKPPSQTPASLLGSSGSFENNTVNVDPSNPNQMVSVEYIGDQDSTFTISSRVARDVRYRFGNNPHNKVKNVFIGDVEFLLSLNNAGQPTFRVLSNVAVEETNDPAAFLAAAVL